MRMTAKIELLIVIHVVALATAQFPTQLSSINFSCYSCISQQEPDVSSDELVSMSLLFLARFKNYTEIRRDFLAEEVCAAAMDSPGAARKPCKYHASCYELRTNTTTGGAFLIRGCAEKFLSLTEAKEVDRQNGCRRPFTNVDIIECTCPSNLCNVANETSQYLRLSTSGSLRSIIDSSYFWSLIFSSILFVTLLN